MFVNELCLTISKDSDGNWQLGNGCAYKPTKNASKFKKYDKDLNNAVVWEKVTVDKTRPLDMFFPMDWPPISLKMRLDSDPLLFAVPFHFNFGASSYEELTFACIIMGLSLMIGCIVSWRYKTMFKQVQTKQKYLEKSPD